MICRREKIPNVEENTEGLLTQQLPTTNNKILERNVIRSIVVPKRIDESEYKQLMNNEIENMLGRDA